MNRNQAIIASFAALLATGCGDYLTGPKLDRDPNRPTAASTEQLFMGMQSSQFIQMEGALARTTSMWVQQMAGTDRQYLTIGTYQYTEDDFSGQMQRLYTGGGLVDMRRIQTAVEESGDRVYAGIVKIWEAYAVGMAASIWGDLPYSEAVGETGKPKLDEQADIYAAIQQKLDDAIADLSSGTGKGPASADLVYAGNTTKWIQAAHTLKARFFLHWAEKDPSNYARALSEAKLGISSKANDARAHHTSKPGEENIWHQFIVRERDSYIRPGKFLVELLKTRNDPRLSEYFAANSKGQFVGAAPNEKLKGDHSNLSAARVSVSFKQPLITWSETQLIIAEAAFRGGDQTTARDRLSAVRTAAGYTADVSTLAGPALLEAIMVEKYVELFQSIESWNDYKRTCLPKITPARSAGVPGRMLYGSAERNANGENIPEPSAQAARNDNDPQACT
ncbi:MAG: SusD/RagB family nutrient-binding outer membrane lipoprotein [Gemmatimonadota bacterium]